MPRKKKNLDSFIIKGNVGDVDNNNGGDNGSKVKSKANSSSVKSDKKTPDKKEKEKDKKEEKEENHKTEKEASIQNVPEKKEKSKRGRKPKVVNSTEQPEVKVPKKRGRKPKPKTEEELQALKEPKVLKKRGRKPKERYGYVVPNVPDVANEEEAVILHLPINTAMLDVESTSFGEKDLLEYNPVMEEPQGYLENSNFQSPFETLETKEQHHEGVTKKMSTINENGKQLVAPPVGGITDKVGNEELTNSHGDSIEGSQGSQGSQGDLVGVGVDTESEGQTEYLSAVTDVHREFGQKKNTFNISEGNVGKQQTFTTLQNFKESNRKKTLPKSTSIFCWWCCHGFDNEPCVLPTNLVMDEYQVIGCFCSPECAAAYNHESFRQHEERLQYSLLNTLYKRFAKGEQIPIKLAPPKICLRIFGGNLSIEEFRENCHNYYQEFTVINPPMVSIIPQIEENQSNLILKKTKYIPLDKSRVDKATEDLRLHRNKPLSESVNTLENCMKLSYQREET